MGTLRTRATLEVNSVTKNSVKNALKRFILHKILKMFWEGGTAPSIDPFTLHPDPGYATARPVSSLLSNLSAYNVLYIFIHGKRTAEIDQHTCLSKGINFCCKNFLTSAGIKTLKDAFLRTFMTTYVKVYLCMLCI